MDFEEVKLCDLKKGKMYKIIKIYHDFITKEKKGIFIKNDNYAMFNINGKKVKMIHRYKFYKPINKENVQNKMERRALNLIIRKIIGDFFY